jgi:hypothetical protein
MAAAIRISTGHSRTPRRSPSLRGANSFQRVSTATYLYSLYGLTVRSNRALPAQPADPGSVTSPGLELALGPQPEWVRAATSLRGEEICARPRRDADEEPAFLLTSLGSEYFQLAYADGTRFLVDREATRVWGDCPPPYNDDDLATYFLGPVMGFILRRRGFTAMHASSVSISGHAIAFSGCPGAGKSTTCAALGLRGAPVLCEDICCLKEEDGRFIVEPGYPRVCLWPSAVEKLFGSRDALPRLTPNWEKCYLPLDGKLAGFSPEREPLGAIYLFAPRSDESSAPSIEDLNSREAVIELIQNTYMNWLLDRSQRHAEFDLLARLVDRVPVRRIVPHRDAARIGDLCKLVVSDAESLLASRAGPVATPSM